MNNLPIWVGVWNATNQASSGAEMSSTGATVAIVIMLVILLALAGYLYYDLTR